MSYLHYDQLGSVRLVSDATGQRVEADTYRPFGEQQEAPTGNPPESKGFIGERFDADAGLQFLNARYYDPKLGLFLQPDWWEVTSPGVGTNRYGYSFNDPVNKGDSSGNCVWDVCIGEFLTYVGVALLTGAVLSDHMADVSDDGEKNGSSGLFGPGHNSDSFGEQLDNSGDGPNDPEPEQKDPVQAMLEAAAAVSTANHGRGQSSEPRDFPEQLVFESVRADPSIGHALPGLNNDLRFNSSDGWQKMEYVESVNGGKIVAHYQINSQLASGRVFDLKIVYNTLLKGSP